MVGAKPVIGTPGTGEVKGRGNYGVAGKRFRMEAALQRGSSAKKRSRQERTRSVLGEGRQGRSWHRGCASKTWMSDKPRQ